MKDQKKEMTQLKQALLKADQEIEKLSRIKSDFLSIVSHELRTPLTSIKESVSLLLDGLAGPLSEEQRKFLTIAKNNINRLTKIITDILDFSRLESGRISMHKRKMSIDEVIREVHTSVKDSVEQNNIELGLVLADREGLTWFDPGRIGQVLRNLISNAVEFNKANGKIRISSSKEHINGREFIKVSVEDTGEGISEEDIPDLFNRLSPLDTSLTRQHKGIGLGLAICKGIIDLHGGDIWVESKKNIGSKFNFTLPIYRRDEEFDFLLDESIERARYNDLKLALIIFAIKNRKDATEEILAELEKDIHSLVRGPEDKVTRFKDGEFIVIMAGTDRIGAEKIIGRMKGRVKIPLNFGIAIYPDDSEHKEDLIKKAEEDLKSEKNFIHSRPENRTLQGADE